MAYVTTSVDIELDDIDTDDLIEEVCSRMEMSGSKKLTKEQMSRLRTDFEMLANSLYGLGDAIKVNTLEDRMKYEHLASVWNKYNSSQMESLLP